MMHHKFFILRKTVLTKESEYNYIPASVVCVYMVRWASFSTFVRTLVLSPTYCLPWGCGGQELRVGGGGGYSSAKCPSCFPLSKFGVERGRVVYEFGPGFCFLVCCLSLCIGSFERMMDLSVLALFSLNEFETRTSSIRSRTKFLVFLMFARTYSLKSGAGAASRLTA